MTRTSTLNLCVAVLAAGQSRRFIGGDKLAQPLHGEMLGEHICETLQPLQCTRKIVVTSAPAHPCGDAWQRLGFNLVLNDAAESGLASSVACAAAYAANHSADALLICLADMPLVPLSHFERLIEEGSGGGNSGIAASFAGEAMSPPAIFAERHFARLSQLSGEHGARSLLANADRVAIEARLMIDIDTVQDLNRVSRLQARRTSR